MNKMTFSPSIRIATLVIGLGAFTAHASAQSEAATKAAKEPGAVKTASGLVYLSLKDGTGMQPSSTDTVRVHYRGTLPNGTEFDSSFKRNTPLEFPLNRVIPCWTEGVQKMKVGGKAKLTCPPEIAYGAYSALKYWVVRIVVMLRWAILSRSR